MNSIYHSHARLALLHAMLAVGLLCFWSVGSLRAETTPLVTEAESLSIIQKNAPAVARAIEADPNLRAAVGADRWGVALQRLSEFSKRQDADAQEALRIIADAIPRTKNPVGAITTDGNPAEWAQAIPALGFAFDKPQTKGICEKGFAAVARKDRLYLMIGLTNATESSKQAYNELRLTIDCTGNQEWDVDLSLSFRNGRCSGNWSPTRVSARNKSATHELKTIQGAVGEVIEIGVDIDEFVPVGNAKPIWTMVAKIGNSRPGQRWVGSRQIPVFNENAHEGAAAAPYVQLFLALCADRPIDDCGLTAAAIAIMSAQMYPSSEEAVRQKIRADNADMLDLAREVISWQEENHTAYRLKDYPLEAQLTWAGRYNRSRFNRSHTPGQTNNDLENYWWCTTSVETLRKLRALAIRDGVFDASLTPCCERIDKWVSKHQDYAKAPKGYDALIEHEKSHDNDPKRIARLEASKAHSAKLQANAETIATFHGKPVSELGVYSTELMLKLIEEDGRFIGVCGHHALLASDMMRALGIAPLSFVVQHARDSITNHIWPARFDPEKNLWQSFQSGRSGDSWWYFLVIHPLIFTYSAEAPRITVGNCPGPTPYPWFFCREVQGRQVSEISRGGISAKEIREWMLRPEF